MCAMPLNTAMTSSHALSPAKAAAELLARRQATRSLAAFIEYLDVGFIPAKHHLLLIEHLEAVERGDIPNLMVWMPPGSAKSTYASVLFPPWFMGRNPSEPILCVSNATELAVLFSRRARNIVGSERYRNVFDFGLCIDTQASGYWENERGGCFMAAGTGTSIPGRRAALGLIDDPVKGRQEADAPHIQQGQWDWYVNDFCPRLLPHAKQLVIQTRWADADLSGRFLAR